MLISCENCQSFMFMVYIFCEQHVCTKVHMHVHPTNSKWQLIHQRMSSFKSSVLYLSFLSLHAYLLSDPPLCVVYTLHLLSSSPLYSLSLCTSSTCRERNLFHLIFISPFLPHLISSQGAGKWGKEKARVKNGVFIHVVPPFLLRICRLFCRKGEFVAHIWEKKSRGKKLSGGVRDGTEQQGTKTGERESGRDFFLKGCQAMSSERKDGTWRERKNAEVSDLFISLKKVTVVYQLTIHSCYCTSLSPFVCYSVFHPIFLPLSPLERAFRTALPIYCNSPSSFFPFPHFPFSSPCISFLNQIYMGFCRTPCLSLFSLSFKHSLMFSSTTVTAFYLDISKPRRSLSPGKMSQLYTWCWAHSCARLCVCVCLLPCLYWRMCVGHLFHEVFWCPEASLRRTPFISSALCCQLLTTVILLSRECLHFYICVCLHEFGIVHTWTRINNWLRWKCSHYRH